MVFSQLVSRYLKVPKSKEGGEWVQTKADSRPTVFESQYGSRQVLDLLSEKWTSHVLYALAFGVKRHGELKREIKGISQKMLTRTLRNLERDGLVKRTVYHVVPPRVEYALTPLGETFSELLKEICTWAETHFAEIESAQVDYDYKANAVRS